MPGLLGYLVEDELVGGGVVLACVTAGYLVWRTFWRHREQRREYRERQRRRQHFWGWE
jgi:hypothetical protein